MTNILDYKVLDQSKIYFDDPKFFDANLWYQLKALPLISSTNLWFASGSLFMPNNINITYIINIYANIVIYQTIINIFA